MRRFPGWNTCSKLVVHKSNTAWIVPVFGVFCGPYFPACALNTEIYGVIHGSEKLRIWVLFMQCNVHLVSLSKLEQVFVHYIHVFIYYLYYSFKKEKISLLYICISSFYLHFIFPVPSGFIAVAKSFSLIWSRKMICSPDLSEKGD